MLEPLEITVDRVLSDIDATLGFLSFGNFKCCTLEDERRVFKVPGKTRIPAGRYQLDLVNGTPMSKRYNYRRGSWHQGMLHLRDVPGFTDIYIHIGNTDADTAGCILVGTTMDPNTMVIQRSTVAYEHFYKQIIKQMLLQRFVYLTIKDSDI